MSTETPDVRPGQVWADNDRRCAGRTLRVDRVDGDRALCPVLTNAADHERWGMTDTRGKKRSIAVARMKPTSTGYRLVTDAPPGDRP